MRRCYSLRGAGGAAGGGWRWSWRWYHLYPLGEAIPIKVVGTLLRNVEGLAAVHGSWTGVWSVSESESESCGSQRGMACWSAHHFIGRRMCRFALLVVCALRTTVPVTCTVVVVRMYRVRERTKVRI